MDIWADAVHLIFPWGSLVAIAVFVYLSVLQLAGKITFAQIGLSVLGDFKVPDGIFALFGLSGVSYGLKERRLRRQKTEEMASHIEHLEKIIDPKRTSSGLTPKGTTRPEDKI